MKGHLVTRLRSTSRDLTHWIVMLAVGTAVYLIGCHFAHASVAAADPVVAMPPIDWTFWIAVAGAVLGGLSAVLHVVAPRTKATWDDKLRDDVDWLLSLAKDIKPPSTLTIAPPPRNTQAGFIGRDTMIILGIISALLAVCTAIGLALTGCATTKVAASAGTVAFVECEDGHIDAQALADVKALATAELRRLFGAGPPDTSALHADLAPIKSDLARCGWAAAIAAFTAAVKPEPGVAVSALVAAGPEPAQVRAAFAVAARQNGWPGVRIAGAVY